MKTSEKLCELCNLVSMIFLQKGGTTEKNFTEISFFFKKRKIRSSPGFFAQSGDSL